MRRDRARSGVGRVRLDEHEHGRRAGYRACVARGASRHGELFVSRTDEHDPAAVDRLDALGGDVDQRDLVAAAREQRAVHGADRAGAQDGDPHRRARPPEPRSKTVAPALSRNSCLMTFAVGVFGSASSSWR